MPIIQRKGAQSSQGFGEFAPPAGGGDGTKGIFALGQVCCAPTTTRNKYTYSSCTSTASGVGVASASSYEGSAAGNSTRGIFSLGFTRICGVYKTSRTRNKYTYSSCTSTASGVANSSQYARQGAAAGNSTRGIFALGAATTCQCVTPSVSNIRDKYTYSTCTSTACGVGTSSAIGYLGAAAGNSTRGIFALGNNGTTSTTTRNKYTYACDTSTASGVAASSTSSSGGAAAGNSTRGIFALGCNNVGAVTTRNKYTYACDTSTASGVGASSTKSYGGSAAGNSTRGIFAIGFNGTCAVTCSTRNKYTYACDTSTASGVASASSASRYGSAASWATCVNT